MALKRTVVRQETGSATETPEQAAAPEKKEMQETVVTATTPEGGVAQVPVKTAKPLDVTVAVNPGGTFVVRVWNGLILYAQGHAMIKTPCAPNKPIKIRITQ